MRVLFEHTINEFIDGDRDVFAVEFLPELVVFQLVGELHSDDQSPFRVIPLKDSHKFFVKDLDLVFSYFARF